MSVNWPRALQVGAMVAAAIGALALLPSLLRAPEPPPLDPRIGLADVAVPAPAEPGRDGDYGGRRDAGRRAPRGRQRAGGRGQRRGGSVPVAADGDRRPGHGNGADNTRPGHGNDGGGGRTGHPPSPDASDAAPTSTPPSGAAPAPTAPAAPAPTPAPPPPTPASPPPDPPAPPQPAPPQHQPPGIAQFGP